MIAIDPKARRRRLRLCLLLQALSVACAQSATAGALSGINRRLPVLLVAGALLWLEHGNASAPSRALEHATATRACLLCAAVLLLMQIA